MLGLIALLLLPVFIFCILLPHEVWKFGMITIWEHYRGWEDDVDEQTPPPKYMLVFYRSLGIIGVVFSLTVLIPLFFF